MVNEVEQGYARGEGRRRRPSPCLSRKMLAGFRSRCMMAPPSRRWHSCIADKIWPKVFQRYFSSMYLSGKESGRYRGSVSEEHESEDELTSGMGEVT